jgi:hypothetical protein
MKKLSLLSLFAATLFVAGCVKDNYRKTTTYHYLVPVYKSMAEVRANIKSNTPRPLEYPGKIYVRGNYIFLNEINRGIHIIDNSNPSQPRNVAFINIPGNLDIAVKGNTLYADLYTDLVTLNISDPLNVAVTKITNKVFATRFYSPTFIQDSTNVITDWIARDTVIVEDGQLDPWLKSSNVIMVAPGGARPLMSAAGAPATGVGGSMARFAITNQNLYTVGTSNLKVFDISNSTNPIQVSEKYLGWSIETIYPFQDKLFIGSMTGMLIYSLSNPGNPTYESQFTHATVCDPVVADNQFAFVTLRSGSRCQGFSNELDIVNVANLNYPTLVKVYPMTNPYGLGKDGNKLFVCDGKAGLKIFEASNVNDLKLIRIFPNMDAYDVIPLNGLAIVVAKDGLYQFDYSTGNIKFLSKLNIVK